MRTRHTAVIHCLVSRASIDITRFALVLIGSIFTELSLIFCNIFCDSVYCPINFDSAPPAPPSSPAGEKQQHGRRSGPLPEGIWHRGAQRHDGSDGPRPPGAHVAVRGSSEHRHRKRLWQGEYRSGGLRWEGKGAGVRLRL